MHSHSEYRQARRKEYVSTTELHFTARSRGDANMGITCMTEETHRVGNNNRGQGRDRNCSIRHAFR